MSEEEHAAFSESHKSQGASAFSNKSSIKGSNACQPRDEKVKHAKKRRASQMLAEDERQQPQEVLSAEGRKTLNNNRVLTKGEDSGFAGGRLKRRRVGDAETRRRK